MCFGAWYEAIACVQDVMRFDLSVVNLDVLIPF